MLDHLEGSRQTLRYTHRKISGRSLRKAAPAFDREPFERRLVRKDVVAALVRLFEDQKDDDLVQSVNDDHKRAGERKEAWRETGENQQRELAQQSARREIEAEINFHKNITIDDVECERAIIAGDDEGMDGGPETIIPRGGVNWPDHYTILLGAGGRLYQGW